MWTYPQSSFWTAGKYSGTESFPGVTGIFCKRSYPNKTKQNKTKQNKKTKQNLGGIYPRKKQRASKEWEKNTLFFLIQKPSTKFWCLKLLYSDHIPQNHVHHVLKYTPKIYKFSKVCYWKSLNAPISLTSERTYNSRKPLHLRYKTNPVSIRETS